VSPVGADNPNGAVGYLDQTKRAVQLLSLGTDASKGLRSLTMMSSLGSHAQANR